MKTSPTLPMESIVAEQMNISVDKLLNSSRRIPWYHFSDILRSKSLHVSNGWDSTIKILKQAAANDEKYYSKILSIYPLYEGHLLSDEKIVKIYQDDPENIKENIKLLENTSFDDVPATESFPFLLSDEQLEGVDFFTPYYIGKLKREDGVALFFFTKRFSIEKIKLDKDHAHNEVRNYLGNYDEVYGIKKKVHQFIDIVYLNKKRGTIEIRLDNIGRNRTEEQNILFTSIERKLELLIIKSGGNINISSAINFYPLVNMLYQGTDGKIRELGFMTDEGSVKNEHMRKELDLRQEKYHSAGKNAVTHISPFRISITWNTDSKNYETRELKIPGTYKDLSSLNSDVIILSRCFKEFDYNFILNKVFSLMNR